MKKTYNNAFVDNWNGSNIQVNAYLFSTDVIATVKYDAVTPPVHTPQYGGNPNYIGSKLSWTHQFNLTKRPECLFALPLAPDWFVTAGGVSIVVTDFVVRSNASKSFDIQLTRLTTDAATCATVSVNEIRLTDPRGILPDVVLDAVTATRIISITPAVSNRAQFTIDPTQCGAICDFSQAVELRVGLKISAGAIY